MKEIEKHRKSKSLLQGCIPGKWQSSGQVLIDNRLAPGLYFFLSFFFFFSFFWPHPWHMKVPRAGIESEPQLWFNSQIDLCHSYGNARSLTSCTTLGSQAEVSHLLFRYNWEVEGERELLEVRQETALLGGWSYSWPPALSVSPASWPPCLSHHVHYILSPRPL